MEGERLEHLAPSLPRPTERLSAKIAKSESEKAAPAPMTTGSIHEPMNDGLTIDGGLRERMRQEDVEGAQRK